MNLPPDNHIDLTDFTADVAARTGANPTELSGRPDTAQPDELLQTAMRQRSERPDLPETDFSPWAHVVMQAHGKAIPALEAWLQPDVATGQAQPQPLEYESGGGNHFLAPSEALVAQWVDHDAALYERKIDVGFDEFVLAPNRLGCSKALSLLAQQIERQGRSGQVRFALGDGIAAVDASCIVGSRLDSIRVRRVEGPRPLTTEDVHGWSPLLVRRREALGSRLKPGRATLPRGLSAEEYRRALYGSNPNQSLERFMSPLEYLAFLAVQAELGGQILPPGSVVLFPDHTTSLDGATAVLYAQRTSRTYRLTFTSIRYKNEELQRQLKKTAFAPVCVPIGLQ